MFDDLSQLLGVASGRNVSQRRSKPVAATVTASIDLESSDLVTLFDTAELSAGALFSATFLMATREPHTNVKSVSVDFLQHTVIQPELVPTCRACSEQSTGAVVPIIHWDLLSAPRSFKRGKYTLPFSCHIPGNIPATSSLGVRGATRIHYEVLATVKYTTAGGIAKSCSVRKPIGIKRVLPVSAAPKLEHRSFEPSATVIDSMISNTAFAGRRSPVRMYIRNVTGKDGQSASATGKKQNRRWSVRNIDCHLYEEVRNRSVLCPEHDGEKARRKLKKQTEQRRNASVYDVLKSSKPLVRSFFEEEMADESTEENSNTETVVTEMLYRVASTVVEPRDITARFLENNDIEAFFKIDFSEQLGKSTYCTDVDHLNVSVRHKVIMEVTLVEEEISYERLPYKASQLREQELREAATPGIKSREARYDIDNEEARMAQPKPVVDSNGYVMRVCADKTGQMQKLKTVFRQALSDTPQEDNLPWEQDVPPCYNTAVTSGGAPPVYITA